MHYVQMESLGTIPTALFPCRQGVLKWEHSIRRSLQFQKPLYWSSSGFWGGNKGPDTAQVALNHRPRLCLLHKQMYHLFLSWSIRSHSKLRLEPRSNRTMHSSKSILLYVMTYTSLSLSRKSRGSSGTIAHAPSCSCNRPLAILERRYPNDNPSKLLKTSSLPNL